MQYEYFYGAQAEQFSFYRIPKALFTVPNFRELSTDAKVPVSYTHLTLPTT